MSERKQLVAYISPMALFVGLLGVVSLLHQIDNSIWLTAAEYWVYPLQTIFCAAVLIWFWREYPLSRPRSLAFGVAIAVLVFVLWIAPQAFFGFSPRTVGFNPTIFGDHSPVYWPTVILRFVRLVVIVPLVEEIFWRGFLLRYFVDEKFDHVPFGTFSWLSFSVVSLAFGFSHSAPDWVVAILTGMLYNVVAYRTKNLAACVLTHATTNLLLGLWIMHTKQWGFW